MRVKEQFNRAADVVTRRAGSPVALVAAAGIIALWLLSGPLFGFSDTWQLVINTATTIVTFLMVFVIQNSQNRDGKAVHAKLDELIRSIDGARNEFLEAETEPEELLDRQIRELRTLAQEHPHLVDRLSERLRELPGMDGEGAGRTGPEA